MELRMDTAQLVAIDVHTHAEVSCWSPADHYGEEYDRAADRYFGSERRPTIDETIAYYRQRKIGLVMFTVDCESQLGRRRIPNEEIAEAAKKNAASGRGGRNRPPHCSCVLTCGLAPSVDGFSPLDVSDEPSHDALPAVGMAGCGRGIARETFLANS